MTIPSPTRWALRVEDHTSKLVLVGRNHDHDWWRDVAVFTDHGLAELVVERLIASDGSAV